MTTSARLCRASGADEKLVTRTLAAAFEDDPVFGWLIPFGVRNRPRRLEAAFGSFVRSYLRLGKPIYLAADGHSVALWSPPGKWRLPNAEVIRETRSAVKAFGRNLPLALRTLALIEGKHPRTPEHWYLGYLGTRPEQQGKGHGAELLNAMLTDCDKAGMPAYLESSNERNLTLYQRHGFEVVEQLHVPRGGPPIWRCWRGPA